MIQPWEFGGAPLEWVAPMRDALDEIWVPSNYVREGYIRSGIPENKIVVVPNGVDLSVYAPRGPRYRLQTKRSYKLLYVGGILSRKGLDVLLQAYTATFSSSDDICLVIKAAGVGTFYADSPFLEQIRQLVEDRATAEVELITDDFSDTQMAGLYRACDALVHSYRGEGFGMPIAEAMASGLPVVVTNHGACLDFCDDSNALLVSAREQYFESPAGLPPASVGYWWAEPDVNMLGERMRWLFEHPEAGHTLGQHGRERMRDFTWERAASRVIERIKVLASQRPLREVAVRTITGSGVTPLPLEGRRRVAFFHHPRWSENGWKDVLRAYFSAFTEADDSTLVLWLDPNQGVTLEDAQQRVMALIGDVQDGPDLLLVPDRLDLTGIRRLYAAVDWVVPNGDELQAERARQSGVRVLEDPSPTAWRAALQNSVHS